MAIALDVADLGKNGADPASGTIAFTTTSAVAAGGFIIVEVGYFDAAITVSSVANTGSSVLSWTVDKQGRPSGAPTSDNVAIISAQATSGLSSGAVITATFSGSPVARTIGGSSFTGVATSSPVDTTSPASGATGVSPSAVGWTTASTSIQAGSLLYATCYNETGNFTNTVTAPSLQAILIPNTASPTSQVGCYRIESTAASYTVAGTWSTAASSGTVAVAYKAAAGTAVSPVQTYGPRRTNQRNGPFNFLENRRNPAVTIPPATVIVKRLPATGVG